MPSVRSSHSNRPGGSRFDLASIRSIPIQSVAADLGFGLTTRGAGRCRLPGHDDRNPSFLVRQITNRFTCYACGGKGDVIDLVMTMKGLDFVDACTWLNDRYLGSSPRQVEHGNGAGLTPRAPHTARAVPAEAAPSTASDREVFGWLLERSPVGSTGIAYLRSRGFSEATTRHFRIGQISDRPKVLGEAVARFGHERLRQCGMTCEGNFGERFVFPTGYLLFPFIAGGEIVYLQARRPDQDTRWRWLCLNLLLPMVYNQDVLSGDAPTISICEGVTDVVSAHELGLVAIGLAGANAQLDAMTLERLRGRNVAVFGDGDGPGARFSRKLVKLLSAKGITAIPKRLPAGMNDLNDHLRKSRVLVG